ncbi:helix-turn-helix domain-containing protein [Streptomyces sp. CA-106131]|uniref:helix-turn-helix domain-containing protein n=1 Tax=Streptomyces sp. CA-106131 TaxID=3240045 RepID=UPI003D924EDE
MNHAQGSAYERLTAVAAQLKVPDAVREVATAPPGDPEPGQIWRAVWEHTVQLVVITVVDNDTVQAIPASLERYTDTHTLLLPAEASTLEQPLALWWGLRQPLPWWVLDRQVSQLTVPLPASLQPDLPHEVPPGARWGSAVPSPAAAAAEYRGVLVDNLARLSTSRWQPEGTGALPQLLQQQGINAKQLAAHLQLQPPQALSVWRGQAPLTPDQAQSLAEHLGLGADEILAANPALPPAVVHELNRPLRRWQVRTLAAQHAETEEQARLRAAFGVFALAARQEDRNDTYWAARADRYFEMRLG